MVSSIGMSANFVYDPGQAPFELVTNDILENIFKPMLEVSDYGAIARVSKKFQKKVQPILDAEWDTVLKSITFGKDKWLNIPGIVSISDEPPFTETQVKNLAAKFKGTCPIFNEPDPLFPHRFQNDKIKKTWETHMLIFFPEFINGKPRTLNLIDGLFGFERGGDKPTVFNWVGAVDNRNQWPSGSYWRLVPRDLFPGSQCTTYAEKLDIVNRKG